MDETTTTTTGDEVVLKQRENAYKDGKIIFEITKIGINYKEITQKHETTVWASLSLPTDKYLLVQYGEGEAEDGVLSSEQLSAIIKFLKKQLKEGLGE